MAEKYANLTDFEKKILLTNEQRTGKQVKVVTPADATPEQRAAIDRLTDEAIKRIQSSKVNIATPKTLADLTPQERTQVLNNLNNIIPREDIVLNNNDTEEAPGPILEPDTISVPLPSFNLGDEEEAVPTVEVAARASVEPKETVEERPHICPNCSWDYNVKPTDISDADKYSWLRATLANKPYSREYSVLGGQIKVTFRVRTKADMEVIHEQIIREANLGLLPSTPLNLAMLAYNDRLRKLNMAASIVSMSGYKRDLPEISSPEALELYKAKIGENCNVASAADKSIFGKWNESLYAIIFKQFMVFDEMCFRLAEASNSPDFWKGIVAPV